MRKEGKGGYGGCRKRQKFVQKKEGGKEVSRLGLFVGSGNGLERVSHEDGEKRGGTVDDKKSPDMSKNKRSLCRLRGDRRAQKNRCVWENKEEPRGGQKTTAGIVSKKNYEKEVLRAGVVRERKTSNAEGIREGGWKMER